MAESLQAMEENVTCSICFEVFRNPITLPCNHTYCRECLQVFADKSIPCNTKDNTVISCPQCRVTTDLGIEGVAGLSVDSGVVDSLTKFASATTVKEALPLCSVCEDDRKAEAVRFCPTCDFLYCDDCFSAVHPMKGGFKYHKLLSMEEYLSKKRLESLKSEPVEQTPRCEFHKQPYIIYCVTCQTVICTGCLAGHDEHNMSDMESACGKFKVPILKKKGECEKIQCELQECLADLKNFEKDIQSHECLHKAEILKAYNRALEALNVWKNNALEELQKRQSDWYSQCRIAVKDLWVRREELERLMVTAQAVSSATHVEFLKGVKQLDLSIDNQLSEIKDCLKAQEDNKVKLQAALEFHPVVSRDLEVKQVARPLLKFTKTSDIALKISENGSLIEGKTHRDHVKYSAWTDGRFQSGHIAWEFEITVVHTNSVVSVGTIIGIVWEDCNPCSNPGKASWCIGMQYRDNEFVCYGVADCPVNLASGYDKPISRRHTGPHRLGFSLNCDERLLTVIDFDHNTVMATVRDIDLSQPVIPAVHFWWSSGSVSARIIPVLSYM